MRNYEVVFIAHPDLEEAAFKELNERVQGWIKEAGGKIGKVDVWGKRKLAYEIRKESEGLYVVLQTEMEPSFCAELERNLRLQEPVMRFLIAATDSPAEA